MSRKRKIFYGWWMVLASAILNFLEGGTFFYGFTVFFNPIRQTFGWTATVTSVAFTLQRIESGILGPVAGFLVDKMGPRKLMLCGWAIVGLGFVLMSRTDSLWTFYGSFLIIAMGFSFGAFMVIITTIANWFSRKRSRALTLISLGFGISGVLVPLLALSISQFGWRETMTTVGITMWVIGLPLSLLMRHKPSQYGYLPDGQTEPMIDEQANMPDVHSSNELAEPDSDNSAIGYTAKAALKTRAFWLLCLVSFFQHMGTSAIFVHIVPYLESVQFSTTTAATVVTGITISSLIGRLSFGFLGDFKNKRYLMSIALSLQTIGLFIFAFIDKDRAWLIVPFLLAYASGYGGTLPLRPALQADYFGTRNFGTIMGLMSAISMLAGLASPIVAGWIFDTTGSYRLAWQLFVLLSVPAIPLMLLAKPPRAKPEP